jgi:iron complex outermembrane receptor protein
LHLALEHSRELAGGWLAVRGDWSAQDDQFFDVTNRPLVGEKSYGLLSGRVAYEVAGGRYTVALFGKNLTDELYLAEVVDLSDFGLHQLFRGEPRTFGVELGVQLP